MDDIIEKLNNIEKLIREQQVMQKQVLNFNETCKYFYSKNPVGKYMDPSLDNHADGSESVQNALKSGPLTDIVNIHNSSSVLEQKEKLKAAANKQAVTMNAFIISKLSSVLK